MTAVSDHAFDSLLTHHGWARPTKADEARAAVSKATFQVVRRVLDMLRVVSLHRTIQPEHVHNLARVAELLRAPLGGAAGANPPRAATRGRMSPLREMRGGDGAVGHTVMTGAFFDPSADSASYSAANLSDHSTAFPAVPGGDGVVRFGLDASDAFPTAALVGGGGGGIGGSGWLTEEAFASLVREYRSRAGAPDLRVSEGARALVRRLVERNVDHVLRAAARASKASKAKSTKNTKAGPPTAAKIGASADAWTVTF